MKHKNIDRMREPLREPLSAIIMLANIETVLKNPLAPGLVGEAHNSNYSFVKCVGLSSGDLNLLWIGFMNTKGIYLGSVPKNVIINLAANPTNRSMLKRLNVSRRRHKS